MNGENQAPAGLTATGGAEDPGGAAQGPAPGAAWPGRVDPRAALGAVRTEVGKAVVGQDPVVTGLLIALLCQGHVLLEGVPGVAKTLLVRTLAIKIGRASCRERVYHPV